MAYPKEVRRLAYELWREDRSQASVDVARKLNAMPGLSFHNEIPADTVADWRNKDNWEGLWANEVRGASPELLKSIASGLSVASLDAIQRLHSIVNSPLSEPKDAIQAARTLLQAQASLMNAARLAEPKTRQRNIVIRDTASDQELKQLEEQARSPSS